MWWISPKLGISIQKRLDDKPKIWYILFGILSGESRLHAVRFFGNLAADGTPFITLNWTGQKTQIHL